jgi:hypothetical protein
MAVLGSFVVIVIDMVEDDHNAETRRMPEIEIV